MRPIKFRGRDRRGNIFYGTYDEPGATIDDWEYRGVHAIEPDSVAQLVGYDSNGAEIYEGDIVVLNDPEYKIEYIAHLQGYATSANGCFISSFGKVSLKVDEEKSS